MIYFKVIDIKVHIGIHNIFIHCSYVFMFEFVCVRVFVSVFVCERERVGAGGRGGVYG